MYDQEAQFSSRTFCMWCGTTGIFPLPIYSCHKCDNNFL